MSKSDLNKQTIEAFARFFDPPLPVTATEKIGGVPVSSGWMCALHLPEHEIGLTAVCWGAGYFKAWIEATGTREDALTAADAMANVIAGLQTREETKAINSAFEKATASTDRAIGLVESMIDHIDQHLADKSPNPEFVDMLGLDPAERLALCREYPDLRFAVDRQGNRKRISESGELVDDAAAGYVASDRLEHVRRLTRGRTEGAADAAIERTCEHDFRKNSIGDQATCWKCGQPGPKVPRPQLNADEEHAEYLRKVAAQQAAYDAERAQQPGEGSNGGTQT